MYDARASSTPRLTASIIAITELDERHTLRLLVADE